MRAAGQRGTTLVIGLLLLSVVMLGESLNSTAWVGLACVVAGVAAMTIPQRKAPAAA